jgi:hypothetical protein
MSRQLVENGVELFFGKTSPPVSRHRHAVDGELRVRVKPLLAVVPLGAAAEDLPPQAHVQGQPGSEPDVVLEIGAVIRTGVGDEGVEREAVRRRVHGPHA